MQPRLRCALLYSAHITRRTCLPGSKIINDMVSYFIRILLYVIIIYRRVVHETPIRLGRRSEFHFDCVSHYYIPNTL